MASEMGVLTVPEERIVRKWRLQPGKMLLIDTEQGRIIEDEEIKRDLAAAKPYAEWLSRPSSSWKTCPSRRRGSRPRRPTGPNLLDRQQAFGYTQEDLNFFLEPMGQDRRGSDRLDGLGHAARGAVEAKSKLLYDYFKQNFAQVTNPPIDPIREELVMSLVSMIGPRPNLLGRQAGTHKRLEVAQPVLTNADLEKIRAISELLDGAFRTATLDATWPAGEGPAGSGAGAGPALLGGDRRGARRQQHPDPVRPRRRRGAHRDPRRAGHGRGSPQADPPGPAHADGAGHRDRRGAGGASLLRLAGYGAEAVNPYLAFETLESMRKAGQVIAERRRQGRQELRQGGRQGRPQGDVEDGHLDLPVLLRRADLRRRRPVHRVRRALLHRHRQRDRRHRAGAGRQGERPAAPRRLRRQRRSIATRWTSAGPMPSVCAARTTPGRRSRCPACSTPCAATSRPSTSVRPLDQRAERAAADAPRTDDSSAGPKSRWRSTRSSRPRRSSSASPPAP